MSKLSFFAVAAMFAATHLSAATPEAAINAATVPGADIYGYADCAKLNAAPIMKKLTEFTEKFQALAKDKASSDEMKKFEVFKETCKRAGISEENLATLAYSLKIGKLIEKAIKASDGEDIKIDFAEDFGILLAISVKKPVSKDTLKNLANEFVKILPEDVTEDFPGKVETADFTHGGAAGFSFTFKIDEDDLEDMPFEKPPVISLALLAGDKVMIAGFESDVKAAVDRANKGEKAEPSAELKKLLESSLGGTVLNKRDDYAAIVMPKVFGNKMAELENEMKDFPIAGIVPALQAAKVLQGLRIAAVYGEKLEYSINLVLDNAESANSLKDFLQINVLGMAKMGLYQLTGKNSAFADSLAAVVDAASTSLNFTLTAADLDLFFDTIKKKLDTPAFTPFFMDEDDDDDD